MTLPDVSICVPTYNGERWVRDAVRAAVSQTYDDVEVVVVDDGSTDGTLAAVAEVTDARVRVVRNARRHGLAGNLGRCLAEARGEWVKFLFQDDVIAPECVERMRAAAGDSLFVLCDRAYDVVDRDPVREASCRELVERSVPRAHAGRSRITADEVCAAAVDAIDLNTFGEPVAWLFHRGLLAEFGGLDERLVQLIDLEWLLRCATNVGLGLVPETLATFRVHAGSATAEGYAARAFRTDLVDRVLLRSRFAWSPHFEALRRHAAARRPPVLFDHLARDLAQEVEAIVAADPAARAEWDAVRAVAPELTALAG
jgi:glycosyltransferase involved in cell wall biosynthesis